MVYIGIDEGKKFNSLMCRSSFYRSFFFVRFSFSFLGFLGLCSLVICFMVLNFSFSWSSISIHLLIRFLSQG